jgi:nucleotide-binding universal stress UspA family protein
MKILVCVDGSKQSMKAVEEAVKIAGGCNVNEVTIIHVCENKLDWSGIPYEGSVTREDMERFRKSLEQCNYENNEKVMSEAKEIFERNNIRVNEIFKEGHPAQVIADVANEEGYDMVVIGSRGLGGLKKLFLGSVSSAVIQEVKSNVYVVK